MTDKERFIELLRTTNRDGIDSLIDYLSNKSDFFEAPASAKYHGAFEGGLCKHSLTVYDNLVNLNETFNAGYANDSLVVVALLHDLSKIGMYEKTSWNKKVYSPSGSKTDAGGAYDWEVKEGYRIKDEEERFIFSNHENTSEFIARQFIPLRVEESVAIMHHMGTVSTDSAPVQLTTIFGRYNLAMYLHFADTIAACRADQC